MLILRYVYILYYIKKYLNILQIYLYNINLYFELSSVKILIP